MRLQGKVAIVTGGGKGIGLRYVRGFAVEGAAVVVAEIDEAAAERAAAEVRASGGRAIEAPTDVSDEASVKRMVQRAMAAFGRIDVLINNAALFAGAWDERGPSEKLTVGQWDRMFAVNVRGTWLCCKHVVPRMREDGGGSIINISSGTAWKGSAGFLHYVTSKAAIAGMTRSLAREYGAGGKIRVNCIAPGSTESETLPPAGDTEH
ncbi:MAG: SDR family NAD(P)-dependent oxidoreductase, partial [Chloroflexota bacterium]|nr:SDR family NAD(P)-dependent oxidoreductase [Chloroflexota bacterium]